MLKIFFRKMTEEEERRRRKKKKKEGKSRSKNLLNNCIYTMLPPNSQPPNSLSSQIHGFISIPKNFQFTD